MRGSRQRAGRALADADKAKWFTKRLKGLKDEARMGFLLDSCRAKDSAVIFAVLSASPFTCGLNREQYGLLREHAIDSFAPLEAKQRQALTDIKEKVKAAMSGYANLYSKHLPKIVADPSTASLAALKGAA